MTTRSRTMSVRLRASSSRRADAWDVRRRRVLLRVVGVETVFVLDEDRALHAEHLGGEEDARVGAMLWDASALRRLLPVPEGRHARHDRDAAEAEVERQLLEVVVQDEDAAVLREQHLQHARVLPRDVAAERREHAGRQLEVASHRVDVARARPAAAAQQQLVLAPSARRARRGSGTPRARPRSMIDWPPILMTLHVGHHRDRVGESRRIADTSTSERRRAAPSAVSRFVRRSPSRRLLRR